MSYSSMAYAEHRRLAVLGYTENPQADGTCCPYINLPRDYFGKPNQAQRLQSMNHWLPRIQALLGVEQQEVALKRQAFRPTDSFANLWEGQA